MKEFILTSSYLFAGKLCTVCQSNGRGQEKGVFGVESDEIGSLLMEKNQVFFRLADVTWIVLATSTPKT